MPLQAIVISAHSLVIPASVRWFPQPCILHARHVCIMCGWIAVFPTLKEPTPIPDTGCACGLEGVAVFGARLNLCRPNECSKPPIFNDYERASRNNWIVPVLRSIRKLTSPFAEPESTHCGHSWREQPFPTSDGLLVRRYRLGTSPNTEKPSEPPLARQRQVDQPHEHEGRPL
jgi:hypothetical protein